MVIIRIRVNRMRNDIRKKAIALLLSVVMTAGMVPAPVFALNGARDQAPLSEDVYEPAGGGSEALPLDEEGALLPSSEDTEGADLELASGSAAGLDPAAEGLLPLQPKEKLKPEEEAVDVSDHPLAETEASDDEPLLAIENLSPRTRALLGVSLSGPSRKRSIGDLLKKAFGLKAASEDLGAEDPQADPKDDTEEDIPRLR